LKHHEHIIAATKSNSWNIRLKQLKHHKHIIETTRDKLLQQIGWRSWNIWNILSQY
jgi:hypothetical protein